MASEPLAMPAPPEDLTSLAFWQGWHDQLDRELAAGSVGASPGAAIQAPPDRALWHWMRENHRRNALLWEQEDLARRRQVPDAEIVANKRAIDAHNQARNDAVERINECLLTLLAPPDAVPSTRLHSETPGSMIDRLSIMGLKIRVMRLQTTREDLSAAQRQTCVERLAVLSEQQFDLATCLAQLLKDVREGRARFKLYRQFKMYNDPQLNPVWAQESVSMSRPAAAAVREAGGPTHPEPPRPDVCQPTGSAELPMLDVYMPMMKSAAVVAAARLGLFEALSAGPLPLEGLAQRLGAHATGVKALVEFLVTLGYLVQTGEDCELSGFAQRWFTRQGRVDYTPGALWTHTAWNMMADLDRAVRDGGPEVTLWQRMQREPDLGPLFSRYMHAFARDLGPDLVARVPVPTGAAQLLDLGGSHGLHAIGLCRAHPGLRARVVDFAASLTDTPRTIAEAGLSDRIDTQAGDILHQAWVQPNTFDRILYLSVGHNQSDEDNARMFAAMARSLRPGGLIVVHDYLVGSARNAFQAAFGLTLLYETGTRTWAQGDYARWAEAAGMMVRQRMDLNPIEKGSLLLIG